MQPSHVTVVSRSREGRMFRWMAGILMAAICQSPFQAHAQDPWSSPGAVPAGFHQGLLPGTPQPELWHGTGEGGGDSIDTMYHLLPPNRGAIYDHDSPLDLTLRETLDRSWFRVDYLLWDLNHPGNVLLGAPMTGLFGFPPRSITPELTNDPRNPFNIVDSRSTRVGILGQVPNLNSARQDDQNGIRGTFGVPFTTGAIEADVWTLQGYDHSISQAPSVFNPNGALGNSFPLIAATSLTADGNIVNNSLILYSEGYLAQLGTNIMGTEINWVENAVTPNQRTLFSPIFGFRYIRIADRLLITGSDIPDPLNNPGVTLNHSIDSRSRNNILGPHFGFRSETDLGRVILGIEPKVLFGVNRIEDSVVTNQLFTITEAQRVESVTRNRFVPALDLSLYVKVNVTEQLSFRVGYDLLWMTGISRSFNSIRYDAPASTTEPPNVGHRRDLTNFFASGLVLGGEYVFR